MKKVQVLLSIYNGEKYLKQQIESILNQKDVNVSLLIRDDGSSDKTIEIAQKMAEKNKNITFYKDTNIGIAKSFMDLVKKSEEVDYYAFADQDDVWKKEKLISAINKLEEKNSKPSLYISALEIVDENLNFIEKKKVTGNFCFAGEMAKNFATGCTMVFNKKLRDIIKTYVPNYIILHDSWITRVCYAIGGNIVIDDEAYIKYRQHSNNVVGYKENELKKLKKQLKIAFKDNISMRVNVAKELKNGYGEMLTEEAKELIDKLITYQTDKRAKKWLLHNKELKTNNFKIDAKIKMAIILNKF